MTGGYWLTEQAHDLLDVKIDRTSAASRALLDDEVRDLALLHAARFGRDAALRALDRAQEAVLEKSGGIV